MQVLGTFNVYLNKVTITQTKKEYTNNKQYKKYQVQVKKFFNKHLALD